MFCQTSHLLHVKTPKTPIFHCKDSVLGLGLAERHTSNIVKAEPYHFIEPFQHCF